MSEFKEQKSERDIIGLESIVNNIELNRIYSQIIEEPIFEEKDKKKIFDEGIEELGLSEDQCFNYLKLSQKIIHNFSMDEKSRDDGRFLFNLPPINYLSQVVSENHLNIVADILTNISKRSILPFSRDYSMIEIMAKPFVMDNFLKDESSITKYFTLMKDYTAGKFNLNLWDTMMSIPKLLNSDVEFSLLKKSIGYLCKLDEDYGLVDKRIVERFRTGLDFLAMPLLYEDAAEEMGFENKFNETNLDLYHNIISDSLKQDPNYGVIITRDLPTIMQLHENHIDNYIQFMKHLMENSKGESFESIENISRDFHKLNGDIIPKYVDDVIFSTRMLGYLDQEFVDGYMDLLLGKDLDIEQKTKTEKTLGFILDQRQILKETKEEVYTSLSEQQKRFEEDGITKERVWDISQLSRLLYVGKQKAESILGVIEPKDNHALITFINKVMADYKTQIQQKCVEYDIQFDSFNMDIIDLGCGDGKKAIEIVKSLKGKVDDINLKFVDNSQEVLNKARLNAYIKQIDSEIYEFNIENLIDLRNLEGIPYFRNKSDGLADFKIRGYGYDFKQINFISKGRTNRDVFLNGELSNKDKEINPSMYLFLGQTLGNFSETDNLFSSLIGLLNPYDLFVIEVDLKKDIERYLKSEKFMTSFLGDLGIKEDLIIDENRKSSYEIIMRDSKNKSTDLETYFTLNSNLNLKNGAVDIGLKKGDKIKTVLSKKFNPFFFRQYYHDIFEPSTIINLSKDSTKTNLDSYHSNISRLYKNHFVDNDSKLYVCYSGLGLQNIPKQIEKIESAKDIEHKYFFSGDEEKISKRLTLFGLDKEDYSIDPISLRQDYKLNFLMANDKTVSFNGKTFNLEQGDSIGSYDNGKIKVRDSDLYRKHKINPFRK